LAVLTKINTQSQSSILAATLITAAILSLVDVVGAHLYWWVCPA